MPHGNRSSVSDLRISCMLRRSTALVLVLAGLAVIAVVAPSAGARPGAPVSDCSSPTLSGPSSVAVGGSYTVTGCGFTPGSLVPVEVTEGGDCCIAYNVGADSSGRITLTRTAYSAGYYRVRASGQRRNGRWIVVAEWSATAS